MHQADDFLNEESKIITKSLERVIILKLLFIFSVEEFIISKRPMLILSLFLYPTFFPLSYSIFILTRISSGEFIRVDNAGKAVPSLWPPFDLNLPQP